MHTIFAIVDAKHWSISFCASSVVYCNADFIRVYSNQLGISPLSMPIPLQNAGSFICVNQRMRIVGGDGYVARPMSPISMHALKILCILLCPFDMLILPPHVDIKRELPRLNSLPYRQIPHICLNVLRLTTDIIHRIGRFCNLAAFATLLYLLSASFARFQENPAVSARSPWVRSLADLENRAYSCRSICNLIWSVCSFSVSLVASSTRMRRFCRRMAASRFRWRWVAS